ncbi:MAG: antibiotic biosynthesis monooxygenase [Anaerolineales bacterium]|nr:antibiotic biosynthesis monooxygenase [Anaerolineales bacterium]MCX7756432.1 antibiotic biosynthesis monooxygenase [Anaerolineales bacterium]MDW8277741.1 putative quinol monooxygenase [Anaerolineales bacterium]
MYVQVVYLEVQPELLDTFLTEVTANVLESRKEPGVERFDLLQQADTPHRFMLYEVYRTESDLESHRQTAHFRRWLENGVPTLTGERVRVLYRRVL